MKVSILASLIVFTVLSTPFGGTAKAENAQPRFAVLVFSKTTGFRHDSIPQGIGPTEEFGATATALRTR